LRSPPLVPQIRWLGFRMEHHCSQLGQLHA
jgi:hypothetical protein